MSLLAGSALKLKNEPFLWSVEWSFGWGAMQVIVKKMENGLFFYCLFLFMTPDCHKF
jgi:hypothetical protein